MRDEASIPQLLACSRCDGPVNQAELVEGIAVRVDGQAVCASCIEILPPAIRVQINRVRALKGLAVATYRLRLPRRPEQGLFTFTNAGLLLLHRRALIHGTEFATPDLPAGRGAKPAAPNQATHPKATRFGGKGLMIGAVTGAAMLVVGGLMALTQSGPEAPPAATVSQATRAGQSTRTPAPDANEPATIPSPPSEPIAGAPVEEAAPAVVSGRNVNDYLIRHATALQALQTAEADQAPTSVTRELLAHVVSERDLQLQDALRWLRTHQLDRVAALLDAMPLPADRAEFSRQLDHERALRIELEHLRGLQARAVAHAPPPVPALAPATASPADTRMPPGESPSRSPAQPKRSIIDTQLWTGPVGPSTAAFSDPDGRTKIPSPWPFFHSLAAPRFVAAVRSRGADRKERYVLRLQFPAALAAGGGVTLCVHPYAPVRKEIAITVLEASAQPERREGLDAGWTVIQIPTPATTSPTLTIQLSDVNSTPSEPFWLGAVASSSGGLPAATELGMQTPGLLVADPLFAYKPLLILLKAAAAMRGEARKWSDPRVLPLAGGIKILSNNDKQKQLVYASIKARFGMPKINDNLMESVDVTSIAAIDKLFVKGANPGLEADRPLVALMPQGAEGGLHPDAWSRRVLEISSRLLAGPSDKVKGGWIPVWVIGRLDGKAIDPAAWSTVRNQTNLLLIDLTANPQPTRGADAQACAQLAESLRTLTYQLRLVQIQQAGK
jgi:hypothetical protein